MELDFKCPVCNKSLEKTVFGFGVAWVCNTCQGRAVTVSLLRHGVEKAFMNCLWQDARRQQEAGAMGNRICPSCSFAMVVVALTSGEQPIVLDVCPTCQFVWFDHRETESLPIHSQSVEEKMGLSPVAREALAMAKVEQMREEESHWTGRFGPDFGPGVTLGRMLWRLFSG